MKRKHKKRMSLSDAEYKRIIEIENYFYFDHDINIVTGKVGDSATIAKLVKMCAMLVGWKSICFFPGDLSSWRLEEAIDVQIRGSTYTGAVVIFNKTEKMDMKVLEYVFREAMKKKRNKPVLIVPLSKKQVGKISPKMRKKIKIIDFDRKKENWEII